MPATLVDQLNHEHELHRAGIERYTRIQQANVDRGTGSNTSYAKKLLPELTAKIAAVIQEQMDAVGAGRRKKHLGLLARTDAHTAAYLGLKTVFDSLTRHETARKVSLAIGRKIEDEIRFKLFRNDYKEYYDAVVSDFKAKGTTDYRHMHRVLVHSANSQGVEWTDWANEERMSLGAAVLDYIINTTNLVYLEYKRKNGKNQVYVSPTVEALHWIQNHMEAAEVLQPELGPTLIPPRDWDGQSLYSGGFYSPELSGRVPQIKVHGKKHRDAIKGHDYGVSAAALNLYQRTPWVVNQRILDVLQMVYKQNLGIGLPATEPFEIPVAPVPRELKKEDMTDEQLAQLVLWKREAAIIYTKERERAAKCMQLARVLHMARDYQCRDEFYFVWQQDSRGRAYAASPGLNPQGCDFVKALLRFKRHKRLGESGVKWLEIHGANCMGVDKVSFDARRAWVHETEAQILATAADPIGNADFWAGADKPYMFLDFCFEWARYKQYGIELRTNLPIGMDGSCNGLQNLSAMLLDDVGGRATNLVDTEVPNDIYQQVADVAIRKLRADGGVLATQWLSFGIDRKCTKRPVMTLPYGSTRTSCQEYIYEYMYDKSATQGSPWESAGDKFVACVYMTDIVWASISEVVVAGRKAMDWLQKASRVVSRKNEALTWVTPTGFKVYQGTMKDNDFRVHTVLNGRMAMRCYESTDDIDSRKQASGVAPNFVHSMDSSHMMISTLLMNKKGIEDFHMIHDDFGCHACDLDTMNECIRNAFVHMYENTLVLEEFKKMLEEDNDVKLSKLPPNGELNLRDVLDSTYFFC